MTRRTGMFAISLGLALAVGLGCGDGAGMFGRQVQMQSTLLQIEPIEAETVTGLAGINGAAGFDGWVWLYGRNADGVGVIRRYEFITPDDQPHLRYSGSQILLTRNGRPIVTNPTGLTRHPELGCFLGQTADQAMGMIYRIDLDRALADGNLDNAVLAEIEDDLSLHGSRPELVRFQGRWYVATADSGSDDVSSSQLRLYDPTALASAERTSELPVLRKLYRIRPGTQSLQWLDDEQVLVLAGPGGSVAPVQLNGEGDLRSFSPAVLFLQGTPTGFVELEDSWCALTMPGQEDNVVFGRWSTTDP